jgi:hypothetical protein
LIVLTRFDSEYGGQSFFTSDGESDFVHDDFGVNDDDVDIDSDVNNILDRVDVTSANDVNKTTNDKPSKDVDKMPNDQMSKDVEKMPNDVATTKTTKEPPTGETNESAAEPKSLVDDDRDSCRTDDISENSATLVTDSITDAPTLTNS